MRIKTNMIIKQLLGSGVAIDLPTIDVQIKIIKFALIAQILMTL